MSRLTVFRILVSGMLAMLISFDSVSFNPTAAQQNVSIETYDDLIRALDTIRLSQDPAERDALVNEVWETLVADGRVPFIDGEQVAFLYRGEARNVNWVGDFSSWQRYAPDWRGQQVGESDLWLLTKTFPVDSRFAYLISIDGAIPIVDPANPSQQSSEWGPRNELEMPSYVQPPETVLDPDVPRGDLTENIVIASENLSYKVAYRVYTPAGYEDLEDLSAIYVLDGQWFYEDAWGSMRIILDNLIAQGRIQPVIAVFVDPRDPEQLDNNRRDFEYQGNEHFTDFLMEELVPAIDASYRTAPDPDARAVMGFSSGGDAVLFIGVRHPDAFHKIGAFSPDIWTIPGFVRTIQDSERLPLGFFVYAANPAWGDNDESYFLDLLDEKGYPYQFVELPAQGHTVRAVRDALPAMFIYFFSPG